MADVRFAVIGVEHGHAHAIAAGLIAAGAVLTGFHAETAVSAAGFAARFGGASQPAAALIDDARLRLVVTVATPAARPAIAADAMRRGLDVLVAKPAAIDREGVALLRAVKAATGKRCLVWFSERLGSPATLRAIDLVRAGAIGAPVHVLGLGPHRLDAAMRPRWFFDPARAGGILADIGAHQVDQFLAFADVADAEIVASAIANRAAPDHPDFQDYGELTLAAPGVRGQSRVDWLSVDSLPVWGDSRTIVTGTAGQIEVRRTIDLAGRPGGEHLLIVDRAGVHHEQLAGPAPFLADLVARLRDGGPAPADDGLTATALTVAAQEQAIRLV